VRERYVRRGPGASQVREDPLEPAQSVLVGALLALRDGLADGSTRRRGGEPELVDALVADLSTGASASAAELASRLTGGRDGEALRDVLGDVLGLAARRLPAVDGEGPVADAWQALTLAADALYGSGVHPLGRLPFVADRLLELLLAEARRQQPPEEPRRTTGAPERILASLAVSRKLAAAVSSAVGFAVVPTYDAAYLYDPPGSHVRTHVDARGSELVFHLILEHTGAGRSALLAHLPGETAPRRLALRPGEAVALRGRGTIHSWEPLGPAERRILVSVGFGRS
jgi:hypothetical protein